MTTVRAEIPHTALDARTLVVAYWTPRRAVWAVVVLGVLLRGWVAVAGFFYADDYILQGRAWRLPIDREYLLHLNDGHLMPGAVALQWVVTRAWPMNPAPLALVETIGSALVVVLFARMALRLWGTRWLVLVPVTIVALSPLTLPSSTWWTSALSFVPLQLALVVTLGATVAWWRSRRQWHLWFAFLVWLPLLTFTESVALVPWVALAGVAVLDARVGAARALARALRSAPAPWAAFLVSSLAYAWVDVHLWSKPPVGNPTLAQLAELVGRGLATTVAPAVAGGPVDWVPVGDGGALGQPPFWLVVASVELLAVIVVVSVSVSPRARRAWIWAGSYLLLATGLMIVGHLAPFADPALVQGLRFTADATIPLALAVGVSLAAMAPVLTRVLRAGGSSAGRSTVILRSTCLALCAVIVLLSIVSTARYRDIWRANTSAVSVGNAAVDLAAAVDGPAIIDQPVPATVLPALAFPYNQVSWLLAPLRLRPAFDDPTTQLRVLDGAGHLVPGRVVGPAAAKAPVPGCGWFVRGASTVITLESPTVDFAHTVRIGYLASGDGSARVALGDGPARDVTLVKGVGDVVVTLVGGGARLRVTDLTPGVGFCTDDVRVGVPAPVTP